MLGLNTELEALENRGTKIKIGLIGTGQMGTDMMSQISLMKGLKIVLLSDRTIDRVKRSAEIAGIDLGKLKEVKDPEEGERLIREGYTVVTTDYKIVPHIPEIDVVLEATGDPNVGAETCLLSLKNKKHFVTLSVEMDITVGVLLHHVANHMGVVYTLAAGDEPPAIKELYDFASSMGLEIIAAGKGKNNPLDRFATPDTLLATARERGIDPVRLTEFVDGTKTMVEMAAVSNATGLVPDIRGMHGPHVSAKDLLRVFDVKERGGILNRKGIVDYVIGDLKPGVFLIFTTDHPRIREALVLRDMGNGPNYLLIRPYHLCSMEAPLSVALAYIEGKPTMYSINQVSDVVAVAKKDLKPGEKLDYIGGRTFFGTVDVYENVKGALPIGLAKNARVTAPISRGEIIKLSDVQLEENIVYRLWSIQADFLSGNLGEKAAVEKALDLI